MANRIVDSNLGSDAAQRQLDLLADAICMDGYSLEAVFHAEPQQMPLAGFWKALGGHHRLGSTNVPLEVRREGALLDKYCDERGYGSHMSPGRLDDHVCTLYVVGNGSRRQCGVLLSPYGLDIDDPGFVERLNKFASTYVRESHYYDIAMVTLDETTTLYAPGNSASIGIIDTFREGISLPSVSMENAMNDDFQPWHVKGRGGAVNVVFQRTGEAEVALPRGGAEDKPDYGTLRPESEVGSFPAFTDDANLAYQTYATFYLDFVDDNLDHFFRRDVDAAPIDELVKAGADIKAVPGEVIEKAYLSYAYGLAETATSYDGSPYTMEGYLEAYPQLAKVEADFDFEEFARDVAAEYPMRPRGLSLDERIADFVEKYGGDDEVEAEAEEDCEIPF